jgi:hypothetical protein
MQLALLAFLQSLACAGVLMSLAPKVEPELSLPWTVLLEVSFPLEDAPSAGSSLAIRTRVVSGGVALRLPSPHLSSSSESVSLSSVDPLLVSAWFWWQREPELGVQLLEDMEVALMYAQRSELLFCWQKQQSSFFFWQISWSANNNKKSHQHQCNIIPKIKRAIRRGSPLLPEFPAHALGCYWVRWHS